MPSERLRALINAEEFLMCLLKPSLTPKVPKMIREQARSVLRHYPTKFYMCLIADKAPQYLKDEKADRVPLM